MAGRRVQADESTNRQKLGSLVDNLREIPVVGDVINTFSGRARDPKSGTLKKSKRQQALDDAMNQ